MIAAALGLTQDEYSIDYAEHIKSSLKKGPERRGIVDGAAPIVTN